MYAKILLCLVLNVTLGLGVAAWFLRDHLGVGEDWLLNEAARGRLQAMSQVLSAELEEAPAGRWDALLERTGETHRVRLALFDATGLHVAGPAMSLPPAVEERLGRPPVVRPSGGRFFVIREESDESEEPSLPVRFMRSNEGSAPAGVERHFPTEALRTNDPEGYWFLVRLSHSEQPSLVAVGMAERPGDTGLLFDPAPWLWAGAGVFGLSVLLWLPLARSVTRSIAEMTRATESIAAGRFDTRVNERRRDELGRLGGAINRMSSRLAGFVAGQKRFLGDAAHELCSPLARIEMGMGVLARGIPETERERFEDVHSELGEMRMLVGELLAFSKAGMEAAEAPLEPLELEPLVRATVEREATDAPVTINMPGNITAIVKRVLFQRALANLLRNSMQYAEKSSIVVGASREEDEVAVTVEDRGPGVAPDALPQLFDPFYRLDSSRSRETGGVGLGLAIVKGCVESCGGSVSARNRDKGGLVVEMRFRRA